ncbi:antitoxin [Mesorhizobium sp.]|uniref:antitoxin n=1 Tax=Mesorhizobium sp. TaxID=1871066 RepID=UPI0025DC1D90|nr:antitoxin [Mesorhizobium sp.]
MPQHRHFKTPPKEAKLFRNNRSQAVRIPVEFELPGEKVLISREGDLVIEPVRKAGLSALLAHPNIFLIRSCWTPTLSATWSATRIKQPEKASSVSA